MCQVFDKSPMYYLSQLKIIFSNLFYPETPSLSPSVSSSLPSSPSPLQLANFNFSNPPSLFTLLLYSSPFLTSSAYASPYLSSTSSQLQLAYFNFTVIYYLPLYVIFSSHFGLSCSFEKCVGLINRGFHFSPSVQNIRKVV